MALVSDPDSAVAHIPHGACVGIGGSINAGHPMALVREDENAQGEVRFVLVGMSREARLLTVCYTLREEETIRLISARKSTGKEERQYAQGI